MKVLDRPILLASKSPRREQLLREAGFNFRIEVNEVAEIYPSDMNPSDIPTYLAELKAAGNMVNLRPDEVLLCSDTIVVQEDIVYEKPKDKAHAIQMIGALAGRHHTVITGVCLQSTEKKVVFAEQSIVHMYPISSAEIEYYVDTYQPYDKAGAYAIQEWIGHCKISKIEGTYNTIMGLPVHQIYQQLKNWDA